MPRLTLRQRRPRLIKERATAVKRHKSSKAVERELVRVTAKIIRREVAAERRAAR